MPITSKKIGLGVLAMASAVALLAGCASAPPKSATAAKSKYLPCIVGDTGGFSDHSFNELSLDGVIAGAKAINSNYKKVASQTSNDLTPGINSLISQKCNLIVTPGFDFEQPDATAAKANPKVNFALIDDQIKAPNVKNVVFETDEAAFLGGYIAASYSKTGVVATYGGAPYSSVTIYEDGIADGIAYYNQQKSKSVKLLGWNVATQKGVMVGNFTSQATSQTDTTNFLNQGADVIIPVAGSLYQGAAAAIKAKSGSTAVLEGVDADIYKTDPTYGSLMLVSILKELSAPVKAVVIASSKSKTFDNSLYIGTLKNDGVGISSFHDFASKVDSGLAGEIAKIKAGIIDGSIKVTSPSSFNK